MSLKDGVCPNKHQPAQVATHEYVHPEPERHDGYSEYVCLACGRREGRWTGRLLVGDEVEPRWGEMSRLEGRDSE